MMRADYRFDEKSLWRMIHTCFLSGIGLFGAGRFFGIFAPGALHIVTMLLAMVFLFLFRNGAARGRILCLTAGAAVLLGAGATAGIRNYGLFVRSYFSWLLGKYPWREEWTAGYEVMQALFLVFLCYLLEMAMEKEFRLKAAAFILLLTAVSYSLFTEKETDQAAVVFLLCYLAILYAEWTQRRWKKEKGKSMSAYMLWLAPFFALYFCLMLWMPVQKEPYGWHFVKNIYEQVRESFLEISQRMVKSGQEDYDFSLSGFTESGGLESALGKDDREIMTIESNFQMTSNVYLTGKVYDTFDGRQWRGQNQDASRERYLDTVETLYALERYTKERQGDYLARARLKIRYRYFHSGFLFAPLKTWLLEQNGEPLPFRESGGSLLFEGKKGYGTEYEAVFYQLNAGRSEFYRFLETTHEEDEDILGALLQDLKRAGGEINEENLERHRQTIYDNYLEEVILSEETNKLLSEITENARTDVEKLRAIEGALSSLTYTRTPGRLPEKVADGSSFLDYFLLESGEGYCNYFATAFVLLARAEGLPARYVQGFCVPMAGRKEATVSSDMAHAWPEVYLEGIGWIPFEPTPGFSGMRYTPWGTKGEKTDAVSGEETRYEWKLGDGAAGGKLLEGETQKEADGGVPEENNAWYFLKIVIVTIFSIITAAFWILLFDCQYGRYRYRRMDEAGKLREEMGRNIRILRLMGIKRENEETLAEFADRAGNLLEKEEIMDFMGAYEEFLYGNGRITKTDVEKARRRQRELLEMLRKRSGWTYVVYRIFPGAGREKKRLFA